MDLTVAQLALIEENRRAALRLRVHKRGAEAPDVVAKNRALALRRRANRDEYFGEQCPHCLPLQQQHGVRVPRFPQEFTPEIFFKLEQPVVFGSAFTLPVHRRRLLQVLHSHPRDARVQFFQEPHVYEIDGVPTIGSVTGLVHAFAEKFDAESVIVKMMAGRNWPRAGYMKPVVPLLALDELCAHPGGSVLLQALTDHPAEEHIIAAAAREVRYRSPALRSVIDSIALSGEEIKDMWEKNGREAANRGTWMHHTFEMHLNRELIVDDSHEFQLFRQFLATLVGFTAYRTEWEIFAERERLAGSIDFAAKDVFGELMLVDWKRSKNLSGKYQNKFKRMQHPLEHLDDISGWHYRLQLNCYKYIIEQYYGMVVSKMLVVCTHPDNGAAPFVDHVSNMELETALLMDWQRTREA